MMVRLRKSKCCNAEVIVDGDTHYYVCQRCGKVCDITGEAPQTKPKGEILC